MMRLASVFVAISSFTACTADPIADRRDDAFTADGKLDGFQCTPAEAAAILKVANEASAATLTGDVGLTQNAANNILATRLGDDEQPGTADDETFATLAELDAVPFIGPVAFQALLDYVRAADLVETLPPRQWTSTTIATGDDPAFALSPDGKPYVLAKDPSQIVPAQGWEVHLPNGTRIPVPAGTASGQIAIDEDGILHVFSPTRVGTELGIAHHSWRAGQWQAHAWTRTDRMRIATGSNGEMFGLAQKFESGSTSGDGNVALVTIAANGSKTTEPLWSMRQHDPVSFVVGSDGYPALAWGSENISTVSYARRGATGWAVTSVGPDTFDSPSVATTGNASAVVFAGTSDFREYRQQGATFARTAEHDSSYIHAIDAVTDAQGITHLCVAANGITHITIDAAGNTTRTALGSGYPCDLALDATGKLHMFTVIGTVLNHATYE